MKCNKCGSDWNTSAKLDKCPFCGESLTEAFTGTFEDVPSCIKYILKQQGADILRNKSKFISFASDFLSSHGSELKLLRIAVDAGVYPSFLGIGESEVENQRLNAIMALTENFFLSDKAAEKAVSWIIEALFEGYISPKPQAKTAAVQPQPAPAPAAKKGAPTVSKPTFSLPNGEYVGETLNGERHGHGVMTYNNYYSEKPNICRYEGQWQYDKRHGFGKAEFPDGSVYEGEWQNGLRCGFGIWYFKKDKTIKAYSGYWLNDVFHGKGTSYSVSGQKAYEGDFANGRYEGFGELFYSGGKIYKGTFKDGKRHGLGTLYGADSMPEYKGYWCNGRKDPDASKFFSLGFSCTYTLPEGAYRGEMKDGKPHGHGRMEYYKITAKNKEKYIGQWHDGKRCGFGIMYFTNGDKYEGEWVGGIYHGEGKYTKKNGHYFISVWKNGKPTDMANYDAMGKPVRRIFGASFYSPNAE